MLHKLFLCLLASTVFASSPAQAQYGRKTQPTPMATPYETQSPSGPTVLGDSAAVNLTGGIGVVDGNLTYGPGIQLELPVTIDGHQFAFGFDTHFYYAKITQTVSNVEIKSYGYSIPIMVSGKYLFQNSINFLKPYVALSMGASISHARGDIAVSGVAVSTSQTKAYFTFFLRPGLTFGNSQFWFTEIPFGLMRDEFAILPTIGIHL